MVQVYYKNYVNTQPLVNVMQPPTQAQMEKEHWPQICMGTSCYQNTVLILGFQRYDN